MPRTARILADKSYYHVLNRGIDKRRLFCCNKDYTHFLNTLRAYLPCFSISILHFCLMPNHIHLLVYAEKSKDLPKFMQLILQVYAIYYRKRYNSFGFVFQNRYKSILIDKDSYLLECARYIERNPLRAKIANNLLEYPWCSFSFYANGDKNNILKTLNPLYFDLGQTIQERQQRYIKYILEERPYENILDNELRIR